MTPREQALNLLHRIIFETPLVHLDDALVVAKMVVDEIKLNCLDETLPFWNNVLKELEQL